MSKTSICFTGLSRDEEAEIVSHFKQANARLGNRWLMTPEVEAEVLVIDMDSMYGQMSLMKALGTGKTLVALTAGSRADTDHLLQRPVTAGAIEALLRRIEAEGDPQTGRVTEELPAAPAPTPAAEPVAAAVPPVAAPTVELPVAPAATAPQPQPQPEPEPEPEPQPEPQPEPEPASSERRLADLLRPGALPGPVRLERADAPALVIDPGSQTYAGGSALKPLLPWTTAVIQPEDLQPVAAADLQAQFAALGGSQPLSRLVWLSALGGSAGALLPGFGPNEKYKLLKWPQTEREWPKHFRIATVMMKGPALLTDIAEASGVALAEVIEFVNASLATGVAEPEAAVAATPEARGGGLLGRFRR